MWENPRESATPCRSPSDLEAWARREAKSESMVVDVLERAGAENLDEVAGGGLFRGLAAFIATLALATVVGGSLWLALVQLGRDAERGRRPGEDRSWAMVADGGPRFGPFHP